MNWKLIDSLTDYCDHTPRCNIWDIFHPQIHPDKDICSCGLDSLLKTLKEYRKEDEYKSYCGGSF